MTIGMSLEYLKDGVGKKAKVGSELGVFEGVGIEID
jgi:hypothetical protein